jgi:hypothetical protein
MLENISNCFYHFIYIIDTHILKIELNKSYCEYQDKTTNIIREKSRTDPNGLWKILNNIAFVLVKWKNYTLRP